MVSQAVQLDGPMLNIINSLGLSNILVIVTRYFGGILLGTGGLVRAYSDVTQKAISEAEKLRIVMAKEFKVKTDYSNFEKLKYYAKMNSINVSKIEYANKIICDLQIAIDKIDKFIADIEKKNLNILEYKEIGEKNVYIDFGQSNNN